MLVLKRKLGEAIIITTQSGETVEIKVSEISEGRVKLGIDAEKSISVLRKEVVEAAKDENRESLQKVQLEFKTYNGKIIKDQKVYFKFKGKTYNLITNSKGITTLTCNIKKGSYSGVVGFKSTSTYGTTKTNIKFKVV